MNQKLDKITQIELREIFRDEARDLTPWLAREENLTLLGDEIGLDIRLIQIEAYVGNFNVDILAGNETNDKKIIIENQLEMTDHDHLGKIITYASGHDANVIICIFRDIREEHRRAIDWLNENTGEDINFFAIKLNLWKIGDSLPAPKFDIICSPNEWAKIIKASGNESKEVSEGKIKQFNYWTKMVDYIHENRDRHFPFQKPSPRNWMNIHLGSSQAHIAFTINTQSKKVGTEIYIDDNKELFAQLLLQKEQIEHELQLQLIWDDSPNKASRIKLIKDDFQINDETKYPEYFDWMYENVIKFQNIFGKYIKQYTSNKKG